MRVSLAFGLDIIALRISLAFVPALIALSISIAPGLALIALGINFSLTLRTGLIFRREGVRLRRLIFKRRSLLLISIICLYQGSADILRGVRFR